MADEKEGSPLSFFMDELKKWATRSIFVGMATALVAIWSPYGEHIASIWDTPQRLDAIEITLRNINENVRVLSGDNRVIRQKEGQSYVEEPVTQGEDITINLVAQRTEFGKDCILLRSVPLFKDRTNALTPGIAKQNLENVLTTEPAVLKLIHTPPPELEPGRVEVYLALEYECDGKQVFDRTTTLTYNLLRAK